jgi:hypothetical protein
VALAMIILLGIAWTFYPGAREMPLDMQPGGQTYEDPGMPSDLEIPVVAETTIPEITPTGNRTFISLDRYRILRGVSPGIKVGDEIIWINEGKDPITVVSDDIPGFTEKVLDVGKRTTPFLFMHPGTYNYYLKNNKNVNGTIKVT